jgi:ElaB/YqjD/DUF883 family membrane-anchored ribosome-binding protein
VKNQPNTGANMEPFAKEDYEPNKAQPAARLGSSGSPAPNGMGKESDHAQQTQENSAVYQKAARKFSGAYDRTTEKVSSSYCKARDYSHDNPGKAMLITLGIGLGIGLLLSTNLHHYSRSSRIAQPVINALSDVATQFFR